MKLALPYSIEHHSQYPSQEYNLIFKEKHETHGLNSFVNFCKEYPQTRMNIYFKDFTPSLKLLEELNAACPQLYVYLKKPIELPPHIKFYFEKPVCSWDQLHYLISLGVSDVYIAGDLTHELPDVRAVCSLHNVNIRLILNKVPDIGPASIKSTFYTPQDISLIENYYDTVEFICSPANDPFDLIDLNWHKFKMLYRAWFDKKEWDGELSLINDDIHFSYPCSTNLGINFSYKKATCGSKCRKMRTCNTCESVLQAMLALQDKRVRLEPV